MKNELLNIDKTSMKALHDIFGFDYNKPHMIHEVNGAFTIRALEKISESEGFNRHNSIMVCVLKSVVSWRARSLMTVKLDGFGGFDVNITAYGTSLRNSSVNEYHRKSDFNDDRKTPGVKAWLICQNRDFLGKRYEWKSTVKTYSNGFVCGEPEIDKSGCDLTEKRLYLRRKAKLLRAEREKVEYLKTDNTIKLAALEKRLLAVKNSLAERLTAARTPEELANIGDNLSRWSGLPSLYRDFEVLKTDDINRRLSSVESFEWRYKRIMEGIEKIQPTHETTTAETITAAAYSYTA